MKRPILPLLLALAALLTCACGHKDEAAAPAADPPGTLRIGLLPTLDCLPFYVADSCGLFDSLGVNVRLVTFEAAMDADTALQRGRVDAGTADVVKACIWRSRGGEFRIAMASDLNLQLVTARTARIGEAKSLKEKIIGITRNSAVDFTADQILRCEKMDMKDLNRPQINNLRLRASMVDQNQYDGALLPEPFAARSIACGGTRVTASKEIAKTNPMLALVVADSTLRARRADVEKIVRAYNEAAERINRHSATPRERAAWTAYLPLRPEAADSAVAFPAFAPATLPPDSIVDAAKSWARGRNLLRKDFKNSELFDSLLIVKH